MRPGEYRFPAGVSMDETIALLARGETVKRKITVAEGLTTTAVLGLIGADEGLTGALPADVEEGSLLPETYYFSLGDTRATLVRRMRESMTETLLSLWDRRAPGLALAGPEEALVLASIIERETALASERARVSAVFHNRLRRGMRLQSDPTVVYGADRRQGAARPAAQQDRLADRIALQHLSRERPAARADRKPGPRLDRSGAPSGGERRALFRCRRQGRACLRQQFHGAPWQRRPVAAYRTRTPAGAADALERIRLGWNRGGVASLDTARSLSRAKPRGACSG